MKTCLTMGCFLVSVIVGVSVAGQRITGRVLNEAGKVAVHVTVQFNKANSVFTNEYGIFSIAASRLPDTLYFFAPGFESYKVLVTQQTATDSGFEVVLLNTRRKMKASEVSVTSILSVQKERTGADNGGQKNTPGSGSYIAGKKLYMVDSLTSAQGSMVYKSGLLTAAEINDFNTGKPWADFADNDLKTYSDRWGFSPRQHFTVQVQNKEHKAIIGHPVFLIDKQKRDTAWSTVTDNTGKAELWRDMKNANSGIDYIVSCPGAADISSPVISPDGINQVELNTPCVSPRSVDMAMVVDATGSMSSEIEFLKIELEDVIRNTFAQYHDLDVHIGSVFYRDKGDEFLTRHVGFQTDLLKILNFIKLQRAGGGGDVPEAVDAALQTALDSLHWSNQARARILFLVTDAPPHDEAKDKIFRVVQRAAARGVRIVPVICPNADKSTEFIMRTMALATNGTYLFLTNDNNAEVIQTQPTSDAFRVQFLNSALERIIKQMVSVMGCDGEHEAGVSEDLPGNAPDVKIAVSRGGIVSIETTNPVHELFLADFTGKVLKNFRPDGRQTKWTVDLTDYPNGIFMLKYTAGGGQPGVKKFFLDR